MANSYVFFMPAISFLNRSPPALTLALPAVAGFPTTPHVRVSQSAMAASTIAISAAQGLDDDKCGSVNVGGAGSLCFLKSGFRGVRDHVFKWSGLDDDKCGSVSVGGAGSLCFLKEWV